MGNDELYAFRLSLRALGTHVPYLLTLQEGDPFEYTFNRWFILPFRPLLSIGFKNASAVQTISTYLAEWANNMGFKKEVVVIPNGVDLKRFTEASKPPIVTAGVVNLITASRLVYKNALDEVIRALVLLPENVQFVVYGSGPDERELRALAEDLKVGSRVLFKGYSSHSDLARAFATAHILFVLHAQKGWAILLSRRWQQACLLLGRRKEVSQTFYLIMRRNPSKGATGWAVDKDSPQQIAMAVKEILTNPEKVVQVRENARALVREKYDWDLIARDMKKLFDRVLGSQ